MNAKNQQLLERLRELAHSRRLRLDQLLNQVLTDYLKNNPISHDD